MAIPLESFYQTDTLFLIISFIGFLQRHPYDVELQFYIVRMTLEKANESV
jgi:hypothetical protein